LTRTIRPPEPPRITRRWQIDKLFAARDLHEWSIVEGDQYKALTIEERFPLDAR
jgi:hypothetical protein